MKEKSIYDQICITRKKITRTEAKLNQLQNEMNNLYSILFDGYEQYIELEMQELFKIDGLKILNQTNNLAAKQEREKGFCECITLGLKELPSELKQKLQDQENSRLPPLF